MIVTGRKVINTTPAENCLFKRFGCGVHLIKNRAYDDIFELMVILGGDTDCLFIAENNRLTRRVSIDKQIPYDVFDEHYIYIKKLEPEELIVRLKQW